MSDDLIAKLEKATGPDRELDGLIAQIIYYPIPTDPVGWPPLYTSSIDAAITLVPDGWAWFAEWIGEPFSEGDARLWIPSQRTQGLCQESFDVRKAPNPAIALCIAALKARAARQPEVKP